MGKKQASTQGEVTSDVGDKDPFRRKIQTIKSALFAKKPERLGAVATKKHVTIFSISERRRGVRNKITTGNFVYKRSGARKGSPLYDKWYKLYKGESVEEAIKRRGKEAVIVDLPPSSEGSK
jgi:hypothetical protein